MLPSIDPKHIFTVNRRTTMSSKNTYIELISTLSIQSRGPNKYLNWYNLIIEKAQNRTIIGYTENHHIVPDCFYINRSREGKIGFLPGSGEHNDNFIKLTPEEHLTAHLLLIKCFHQSFAWRDSLIFAANMMCIESKHTKRINNKEYGWLKRLRSIAISSSMKGERNHFYNKTHTEKSIKQMKQAKIGENNPCFGTIWITNGVSNKRLLKSQLIPENWKPGRILSKSHIKKAAEKSVFGQQFFCFISSKQCYDKANLAKCFPEFKQQF